MKFVPHLLWLTGTMLVFFALIRGSGTMMPYPDPTPELLAAQRNELHAVKITAVAGSLLLASGGVWILCRKYF